MQSATEINEVAGVELVPADQLREMTATQEVIFNRQKANVLESLMGTMLDAATKNGSTEYTVGLNSSLTQELLAEIVSEFQKVGYTVKESQSDTPNGPMRSLTVAW